MGRAQLCGYRFIINERGVATIQEDQSSSVFGVLWEITEIHERELDRREGVAKGSYNRIFVNVNDGDGVVTALTYQDPITKIGRPRDGYLPRILSGAAEHELPPEYYAEIARWSAV